MKQKFFPKRKIKIGLVCSRGGHLLQLYLLKKWWSNYERFWITGEGEDASFLLRREKVYFGFFPEHRNIFNAIRNFVQGWKIIRREKPNLLVSTGAGIAPPVFLAGKLLGCRLIFIEPYDFVAHPSLSGKLIYILADKFLIQHQIQQKFFPKAEYWGSTL